MGPATGRSRSKPLLIIGILLLCAAVALLAAWGKREAAFRARFAKMGGGPDTTIASGGTETFEQKMEDGRWKLVRVDRGSEGEITGALLYSGAVVGLGGIGLTALGWVGRKRSPAPADR